MISLNVFTEINTGISISNYCEMGEKNSKNSKKYFFRYELSVGNCLSVLASLHY